MLSEALYWGEARSWVIFHHWTRACGLWRQKSKNYCGRKKSLIKSSVFIQQLNIFLKQNVNNSKKIKSPISIKVLASKNIYSKIDYIYNQTLCEWHHKLGNDFVGLIARMWCVSLCELSSHCESEPWGDGVEGVKLPQPTCLHLVRRAAGSARPLVQPLGSCVNSTLADR